MEGKTPAVSIILPVYNRETTIERAVESVLRQSINDWELIIVDDGSTDRSGEICDEYMLRDSRIKVIHSKHVGVACIRNTGLKNVRGEWVAFLDSDDEYLDNALSVMLSNSENTDFVIALGDTTKCSLNTEKPMEVRLQSEDSEQLLFSLLYSNLCSKLFRRSRIHSCFDETINKNSDCPFTLDYIEPLECVKYVPVIVSIYHVDSPNRFTKNFSILQLRAQKTIFQKTVHIFRSDNVRKWAALRYVEKSVVFFALLSHQEGFGIPAVHFLVQSQIEENIMPLKDAIDIEYVPQRYRAMWEALCSGDSGTVISLASAVI